MYKRRTKSSVLVRQRVNVFIYYVQALLNYNLIFFPRKVESSP